MALNPLASHPLTGTVSTSAESSRKADVTASTPKADETRLSSAASVLSSAANATGVDVAKIDALRAKIADGSYQPNPRAIADKLLQEAWLSK